MNFKYYLLNIFLIYSSYGFSQNSSESFPLVKKAIEKNDLKSLKTLLSGENINMQDEQGYTPLHTAIFMNKKKIAEWILENKADVHAKTKNGRTALHIASSKASTDIVKLLIQKYKANVNALDKNQKTPLHHLLQITYLNPHLNDEKKRIPIAQLLLKNKANPNLKDFLSETPLHIATHSGYAQMTTLLLAHKANVNAINKPKQTPLHQAIIGASYFKKRKKFLHHNKVVDLLLKKNPKINAQDASTYSALHYAAEHGLTYIVNKLLDKKANINLQTKEGWTALHMASGSGHLPVVETLIKKNARVDIQDKNGTPPLYFAVGYGSKEIVALLLKSNALTIVDDKIVGASFLNKKQEEKLKNLLQKFKNQIATSSGQ